LLLGGVLIGPHVLGLAETSNIQLLSNIGLGFLFLLAGYELDPQLLRQRPGRLAILGWIISAVIAVGVTAGLGAAGYVRDYVPIGLALTTTALGTLLPILRDNDGMFGRKRRQERRFDQEAMRYQMRERMISIGDDYEIENERGERVYKLDGKALRIRKTILFKDMDGRELAKIQERMLHIKDSMEIEGPDGNRIAIVKKALITPLRERWIIKVEDGQDLDVHGNIVDHEYQIERDGVKVAEVSKRWFRIRDTYGVEVAPGENDILILASAAVLDTMAHPAK
jgi:uncharacterized protein YxjI